MPSGLVYGLVNGTMETDCVYDAGIPDNSRTAQSNRNIHVDWFYGTEKVYSSDGSNKGTRKPWFILSVFILQHTISIFEHS
jgi:hypothetical protein